MKKFSVFVCIAFLAACSNESNNEDQNAVNATTSESKIETLVAKGKETLEASGETASNVVSKTESVIADTKAVISDSTSKMQEKVDVAKETLSDAVTSVKSGTTELLSSAKEAIAPSAVKPLDLAKKSGCLACHSVEKKIVGPAWKDVGAKYKGDSGAKDRLIEKVSKGGKGSWTEVTGGVPMPPYYPRVSKEDISTLVDFILAL